MSTPSTLLVHAAIALAHAPRVRRVLHRPVRVAELGREVRLHQRQVAPHVEDLVEDLDVDRADLVARLARRTRPHLFGGDALEQRVGRHGDLGIHAQRRRHRRCPGESHHLAGLEHDLAWVERLAGRVCRADRRAPPAHRAGVGVEQLLPREVFDGRRAERLELGLHQVRHGLHRTLGPRSRLYMFNGDVNMCRSIVIGKMTRNVKNAKTCSSHIDCCQPCR